MPAVWDLPFRLGSDGAVFTVEQGSDRDTENLIAAAVLTRPGEREQVPTFGVADPAFTGWETTALGRHLLDFGPEVDITDLAITRTADNREEVAIGWEQA
ncbi:MAG: hypothetical protein ACRDTZ_05140 [Pseudonocardiaceae bacterium]